MELSSLSKYKLEPDQKEFYPEADWLPGNFFSLFQ